MLYKNKNAFFDELAKEAGYVDPETIKAFYIAMVRLLLKKLRYEGEFLLPDFGKFGIVKHKSRMMHNVNSRELVKLPEKRTVRFYPDYKLKEYIHNMKN